MYLEVTFVFFSSCSLWYFEIFWCGGSLGHVFTNNPLFKKDSIKGLFLRRILSLFCHFKKLLVTSNLLLFYVIKVLAFSTAKSEGLFVSTTHHARTNVIHSRRHVICTGRSLLKYAVCVGTQIYRMLNVFFVWMSLPFCMNCNILAIVTSYIITVPWLRKKSASLFDIHVVSLHSFNSCWYYKNQKSNLNFVCERREGLWSVCLDYYDEG